LRAYTKPFFLSVTFASLLAIGLSGCEKSEKSTSEKKSESTAAAEITDLDIATQVKSALTEDNTLGVSDITVTVSNGDVRLTGFVDNEVQLEHALDVARSVPGVRSVKSELNLKE